MRKVTIEDISRQTGLSRGTVSRALNNRPDISEKTKQRVLEACQTLNYVPSHAARSLATGRNYSAAAILDRVNTSFAAAFLRGALSVSERERYALHLVELGDDATIAVERLRTLSTERIDAALIAGRPCAAVAHELASVLSTRTIASTVSLAGLECDTLAPDYAEAGRLAARFLLARAPDAAAYIHRTGNPDADAQLRGFTEVCEQSNANADKIAVSVADARSLPSALEERLGGVRAIAATDDFLAITAMLQLAGAGRKIGQDVAVLGSGDSLAGRQIVPTLSSIDFSGEEIGRRSMEIVLQRLGKERLDAVQRTEVAPRLIHRESSGEQTAD